MNYDWLINLLKDADVTVRDYSGRGMYGSYCLGVVIEEGSAISFVADILDSSVEFDRGELAQLLRSAREDSMGHGTILYFPQVVWQDRWDEDSEDEDESDED